MITLFQVTIKLEINGNELPAITSSSENSFESCYDRISDYLASKSKEGDKVSYEILHTSVQTFKG